MTKRQDAFIRVTIHSLFLPKFIPNFFSLDWKVGHNHGITEHSLSTGGREIIFEKQCHFKSCFKVSTKKNQAKSKKIAFTVYEYRKNSKRNFGEFKIDLSAFYHTKHRSNIRIVVKTACKQQVVCTVSIQVQQIEKFSKFDLQNIITQFDEENDKAIDFTKTSLNLTILPLENQNQIHDFISKLKVFHPNPLSLSKNNI